VRRLRHSASVRVRPLRTLKPSAPPGRQGPGRSRLSMHPSTTSPSFLAANDNG
jgi:hypothetical protein